MSTLTIGVQNGNIGYVKDTNGPVAIETNVNLLDETAMRVRLLCDFIKDALTKSPLNTEQCKQIIGNIYCNGNIESEPDVNSPPSPMNINAINTMFQSAYETSLAQLEKVLDTNGNIKANTTKLINQPKLSTVGSNTKISDATHVFWESGFGSTSIMRSPQYQNILTPAAIMDPLSKEASNAYFPPANLNIIFDKTFTKRLGFPDTRWGCFSGVVSIQYTQLKGLTQAEILSHPFSKTTTKEDVKAGLFANYVKGNKEKNEDILKHAESGFNFNSDYTIKNIKNNVDIMHIIKILETKELGDVAQVWLYLAYLIENNLLEERETALMITTDSVVYLFCQLLNLSCAYTGSRAGVESKNCSIYHYIAGKPNYQDKISNMLTNACDIVAQKIASQKFIMASVKADDTLSNFWYIGRTSRSNKLTEIPGRTEANPAFIIQKFEKFLKDLETKEQRLEAIKKDIFEYLQVNLHIDDSQVVATFDKYHSQILQCQCEHYFTVVKGLKGVKYLLQDVFRDELYPHLNLTGGSSIDKVNYMINETSSSKFISQEKNYVGGIRSRSDINNEISFLEATILTYSYIKLFTGGIIEKLIEEDFDNSEISLLAMTYENNSYYINDEKYQEFYTYMIGQPLDVYDPSTKVKVSITLDEENILVFGTVLSQYLYFSDDLSVVLPAKSVGLHFIRAARSVPTPIFEPNIYCDGKYESPRPDGRHVKIPVGTGMYIYELCYTAHSFVVMIRDIINSNKGISFTDIFKQLFQNLLNNRYGEESYTIENFLADGNQQKIFLTDLKNILAFIFTFDIELYKMLIIKIQQEGIPIPKGIPILQSIPIQGILFFGTIILVHNSLIKFAVDNGTKLIFGGSNKYLLKKIKSKKNRVKKIKSKKNRVKKIKSKKNRVKKIKSKQHRLKKIKSKKFTRKNKKSKNGVI